MNILQNELLEEFRLEGRPLAISKCKFFVDVLLPALLVEWFERPL
jgi:hypothetical protein